ncbi:hypothetical protein ACFX11_024282 [Malus domestica]
MVLKASHERTVVWEANREIPVSERFSALRIVDGNLVVFNESKTQVWSTNLNSTTNSGSVQAVLLDSGNLVLRAGSSNNTSEPLWQSFDHPTHTWLPGGKLGFNNITKQTQFLTSWKNSEDPSSGLFSVGINQDGSNSYSIWWNRTIQYWTSGSWDASSRTFRLDPDLRLNSIYNFRYVTNENISYFTYSPYDPKLVYRCLMSVTGQVQLLSWMENTRQWNLFWSQPRRQCEVHATCGHSGVAMMHQGPSCGTEDRFLEMHNMLMPENKQALEVRSVEKCGSVCLSNCSCTAYAYDSSTGCSIWTQDILGVEQLAEDDSHGRMLYIRLAASELMYLKSGKGRADKRSLKIALVSAAAGLFAVSFGYFLWKKTLGKKREHRRKHGGIEINYGAGGVKNDTELPLFGLKRILAATDNFS